MAGGSVPPGWYADPAGVAGRWRWWDGQQWTEVVRGSDEAAAGQATAEHDAGQPDRAGRPEGSRGWSRWLLAAAAIVALAAAGGVTAAVIVAGGGSSSDEAGEGSADRASAEAGEGQADAGQTEGEDEAAGAPGEGDPAPSPSDGVATTWTVVELALPAGSSEQEREAAADTLAARAQAVASGASVDLDGDQLTVTLPGVADAAAGELLIGESVLSVAAVLETRTVDHDDWPGCVEVDADEPEWVCEDDEETAHLLDTRLPMRSPSAVELAEHDELGVVGVNVDLADADLERFTELTAEIACERDAGRSGRMALSVGSRLVGAPAMGPQVACGQGLPDGSFTISVGPDSPRESAEQLVDALGSSLDVVPELQNVHVVE